jgi:putative PIN family toxin of toxin-antitoxin system
MPDRERIVLDTNVVVSAIVFPDSKPSMAMAKAQQELVLASDATLVELVEVMSRSRFDRYLERSLRQILIAEFINGCEVVPILHAIRACRDPKDDKFLEVAVHGRADLIVTGDLDLLALHPFRGVGILTPLDYLALE